MLVDERPGGTARPKQPAAMIPAGAVGVVHYLRRAGCLVAFNGPQCCILDGLGPALQGSNDLVV